MTQNKSFLIFIELREVLRDFSPEVCFEVYDAVIEYIESGTLAELKPAAKMAFAFIRKKIDSLLNQENELRRKRSEGGKKGMAKRYGKNSEALSETNSVITEPNSVSEQKEIPLKEIPPLNPLKKYTPKKNPPTPTKKISPTRTPEEQALERLDSLLQEFHDGRHQIWEDRVMKKFGVDSLRPYYESFRNHVISQGKVETTADIREIKSYFVNSFRFFTKANPVGQLREHEDSASGQTFRAYCKWVREEAGNVARNLIPMTEKEFDELLGYYGNRRLFEAIQQINEREDLTKKYYSLYRLVIKWIENEKKK